MSRTVPLKEAASKDQTPLCSSPIKTPTTQDRYRDDLDCFFDTNDEICFFDTNIWLPNEKQRENARHVGW